jgi:hypothetical protein
VVPEKERNVTTVPMDEGDFVHDMIGRIVIVCMGLIVVILIVDFYIH